MKLEEPPQQTDRAGGDWLQDRYNWVIRRWRGIELGVIRVWITNNSWLQMEKEKYWWDWFIRCLNLGGDKG